MTKCEVSCPSCCHYKLIIYYSSNEYEPNTIRNLFFSSLVVVVKILGAKMHLQRLSIQQEYTSNLEAFTQAALILCLAVAIITSNALIIATILNFRGEFYLKKENQKKNEAAKGKM